MSMDKQDTEALRWHKSACNLCYINCGVELGVRDHEVCTVDKGEEFLGDLCECGLGRQEFVRDAVDRERSFDLVGVGSLDAVAQIRRQVAVGIDGHLDLADRIARNGGQHIRAAECHAPGVVAGLVETRRRVLRKA